MLSKSVKYALKAVLYLAVNSNEKDKVMVKDLVKPINVPPAYIAKLLQELSKHKVISSTRGPKGGFYLSAHNKQNSIMTVIDIIDGDKKMTDCLLNLKKCNEEFPCPLHDITSASRAQLFHSFKTQSIGDLALEIEAGRAFLPI